MMKSSSFIPLFSSSSSSSHTHLLTLSISFFLSFIFSPILRKPIHRVKEGSLEWNYEESGEPLILFLSFFPSFFLTHNFSPSLPHLLTHILILLRMDDLLFLSLIFFLFHLSIFSPFLTLLLFERRKRERKENKVKFLK